MLVFLAMNDWKIISNNTTYRFNIPLGQWPTCFNNVPSTAKNVAEQFLRFNNLLTARIRKDRAFHGGYTNASFLPQFSVLLDPMSTPPPFSPARPRSGRHRLQHLQRLSFFKAKYAVVYHARSLCHV